MGKQRALDCGTRESQTFAKLTYRQRDLWHGLIAIADDQGRMPGQPAYVRSRVWPYEDIGIKDVAADLNVLIEAGNIISYIVKEQTFIQIVNWWKYQKMQWAGLSDHPAPPGWIDRARYHTRDNKVVTLNWDKPGGFTNEVPTTSTYPLYQRNDVNDDVKGNDEGKGEDEVGGFGDFKTANFADYGIRVWARVTGMVTIPGSESDKVIPAMDALYCQMGYNEDRLAEYLKPYWEKWKTMRGKNGAPFKRTNAAWLYDWAVSGEDVNQIANFPRSNGATKTKQQLIQERSDEAVRRVMEKIKNGDAT